MLNKTRGFAVIAVLFLLVPGCLFAQTPKELGIGSWVPAHLYAGEEYWYSVRPSGTGFLTVETTGGVDTYLEAYDASHNLIDENDDGGEEANARLDLFVESGKTYLFMLMGYDENETGPYSIRALFEAAPADEGNTQRSKAVTLKNDDSIPVFFRSSSESRWYSYDLSHRSNLLIILTKGDTDTYLKLYDSQGNLVAEDDDSWEDGNAMLSERVGPGTYYIEVTLYTNKTGRTTIQTESWYRD
jgi:hypothetical protein